MRIGIMTGGGDAPGLNGIIEAATKSLLSKGHEVLGIADGFEGIFNQRVVPLTRKLVHGINSQAGTLLGSSNRSSTEGREKEFLIKLEELKLDGLIVAGGDGTFRSLQSVQKNLPLIGVPKTIDNDLPGTDVTFGYDTACSVICQAVDSLKATARAHKRILVVETMGRTAGWLALGGGVAGMADMILIPEIPFSPSSVKTFLEKRIHEQRGLIIVVSEGVTLTDEVHRFMDKSGQSQIVANYEVGQRLAQWIQSEVEWESRHVVLGHLQRSHAPSATDRFLTLKMGLEAARLAHDKKWGMAASYRSGRVRPVPIEEFMGPPRVIQRSDPWVAMTRELGISLGDNISP